MDDRLSSYHNKYYHNTLLPDVNIRFGQNSSGEDDDMNLAGTVCTDGNRLLDVAGAARTGHQRHVARLADGLAELRNQVPKAWPELPCPDHCDMHRGQCA